MFEKFATVLLNLKNFSYPTAIEMVASGRLKLDKLTRAHFKFEDSVKAFEKSSTGDVVKVFIHYDESS